jgi:hypothetical protein
MPLVCKADASVERSSPPRRQPQPAVVELADLDGENGFTLIGPPGWQDIYGSAFYWVSSAGDMNDDGFDDIVIGAPVTSPSPLVRAVGTIYVVFGTSEPFSPELELADLDGSDGFAINGIRPGDFAGQSVSAAGDVNGDGVDDIVIGASGEAYVVFGSASGLSPVLELSALDGTNGFRLNAIGTISDLGDSVSGGADLNGDGIDDVIVGATSGRGPYCPSSCFEGYVVFGTDEAFPPCCSSRQSTGQTASG